jgi:hypothetical protein
MNTGKEDRMPRKVMAVVVVGMFLVAIGCGGGKKSVTREKGGAAEETAAQETAVQETPSKGGTAKDSTARNPVGGSHEDRTYIDPSARLSNYKAVLIEPPKMDTTASRNPKVDDFLNQLSGIIRGSAESAVKSTGKFPLVTQDPEAAKKEGKYLVCRNDVLVHFGSTAARVLIGFGAGRSKLVVVPSLVDPETGEVVLKYTGWGSAPFGYGFQVLQKMQIDALEIENYFGMQLLRVPN